MTLPDWIEDLVSEPDRALASSQLGPEFVAASAADRELLFAHWNFGERWPYPKVERLACTKGERTTPRARVSSTLVLEALETAGQGWREFTILLAHLYRSAELAGLDPAQLFEEVAAALPAESAAAIRAFAARSRPDRAPGAFGLQERTNADGETELFVAWHAGPLA